MLDPMLERAERLQVFQIAYVMTDEGVIAARQAESVFEFRAAGQNLTRESEGGLQGAGRVAARAAQDHLFVPARANHRIIRADVNAPVVKQKVIGDFTQSFQRVSIFVTNRLVGD